MKNTNLLKYSYLKSCMNILLCLFCLLIPHLCNGDTELNDSDIKELTDIMVMETKHNTAAVQVFFSLREIFQERLKIAGGLHYCGKDELAIEIMPSVTELSLEAVDIVDSIDLSSIGITTLTDKDKSLLIKRAVTAATVYVYSTVELGEFFEIITPTYKDDICNAVIKSYKSILSDLQK
ncbi:MAG TPA: hypothetical protein VFF29_06495 [Bacteroidota bacterium]|nr:hypothetical protein [Bacteroidota bacterium]